MIALSLLSRQQVIQQLIFPRRMGTCPATGVQQTMRNSGRSGAQPTIADVARVAGVSVATAARVLRGYGYAGSETRQRVFDAAKHLAYQLNLLARSMVTAAAG
jgi:Bacterial regulatory proteins, lacI family